MSAESGHDSELLSKFWNAVCSGDLTTVTSLLEQDASLATVDCRPPEKQDPHTHGFPLVQAAKDGNLALAQLLLQHGADPDARSPSEDQRELGMPLQLAIEKQNYELANLLLDHGASVHGYPYCDQPTIEQLFYQALEAGAPPEMVCPGFQRYLGEDFLAKIDVPETGVPETGVPKISADSPEPVKLFDRFLKLGGQPNLVTLLRTEQNSVLEKLLRTCPDEPAPALDYPRESMFHSLVHSASWFGYPKVIRLAMNICPGHYTGEVAQRALGSAIISHNRDGSWQEYHELIKSQLDFLTEIGELEVLRSAGEFQPLYLLAENYCWPRNYGYKAGVSSPEGLLALAQLFLDYGFDEINYRHPESNRTPLGMTRNREGHPGMHEFGQFLIQHGGTA